MLGQRGAGVFGQLFDMASGIVNGSVNPKEVFERQGITVDTIRKAKTWLNFPGVGWLINKYGSKEQLLKDLDKLECFFEGKPLIEQAPISDLEQMQRNLTSLK